MYGHTLVPPGFAVPERLDGEGYHLRMLSIDDVEKDFEAVMASADRLTGLLDPGSSWPGGLTPKEDLIDLAWHQREFTLRRSFAYTVMPADERSCLGCVYIFPSSKAGFDAAVFYWVRSGAAAGERDAALGALVKGWLATAWPFERVAFPGREQAWRDWQLLPSSHVPRD